MGIAAADYDHSGFESLIITNFSNEMLALYHNEGNGLFMDESPHSEIGRASLLTLGFGCFLFDYNLDGWPDMYAANGHIDPDIKPSSSRSTTPSRRCSSAISATDNLPTSPRRWARHSIFRAWRAARPTAT